MKDCLFFSAQTTTKHHQYHCIHLNILHRVYYITYIFFLFLSFGKISSGASFKRIYFFFVENAPPISTYAKMKGNTVAVGIGIELGREGQKDNLWDLSTIVFIETIFSPLS